MFHTTSNGQIALCHATARACPLAPVNEHYDTIRQASHAVALETLERQGDYQLSVPAGWGETVRDEPAAGVPVSSLSVADFEAFKRSSANSAKPVNDDWRETIARNAALNGDTYADGHADTSVSGYYDSTPDEDDELPNENDWAFQPF